MSWIVVAKKDFRDAVRSRMLWALIVLFVVLMGGLAYVFTLVQNTGGPGRGQEVTALALIDFLISPVALLVPITGLIVGHKAIVGERESGSIKFLLSMPHTRQDVVIGKILGRSGVLGVGLVIGIAIATAIVIVLYDQITMGSLVIFTLLTLLFGVVYVVIGVSISAVSSSGSRATTYAVAFFVVFELLWDVVPYGVHYLLEGSFVPQSLQGGPVAFGAPGWFYFLGLVSPSGSFSGTITSFVHDSALGFEQAFPEGVPFYLTEWAALALLGLWLVIPAVLGYLRFRSVDL